MADGLHAAQSHGGMLRLVRSTASERGLLLPMLAIGETGVRAHASVRPPWASSLQLPLILQLLRHQVLHPAQLASGTGLPDTACHLLALYPWQPCELRTQEHQAVG